MIVIDWQVFAGNFQLFYIYWVTSHFVGPDIAFIQCCFEFNKMLSSSLNMNSSYEKKIGTFFMCGPPNKKMN